ncbi:MAG TPA: cell wall hydrolase [Rhizomicrobium sp.]|nr:cell wall hydrolase [Rhizomicrobium sp.]
MNPRSWSFETAVRTVWQEARGEPDNGKQAVAHVIWNRLRTGRWGKTLAGVCLAPLQFSGWNAHDPNRAEMALLPDDDPALNRCREIFAAAENEPDPTHGATLYYAESVPAPPWTKEMRCCGVFGSQVFYRPKF